MIEKIETEADHKAALARIELLFDAPEGSQEFDELIRLADLVNDYEDIHYPMGTGRKSEPPLVNALESVKS